MPKKIHALRRKIREERKAIDFYLPEYRPVGKDNKIIKFKSINHLLANEVIEESMILANICAAKLTKKLKNLSHSVTTIIRITMNWKSSKNF